MGQSPRGGAPQLPADIPPEHAEAYLMAFQLAYDQASVPTAPPPALHEQTGPDAGTESPVEPDCPDERSRDSDDWQDDDSTAPAWLIPLLTIILLAALCAAVYALGR